MANARARINEEKPTKGRGRRKKSPPRDVKLDKTNNSKVKENIQLSKISKSAQRISRSSGSEEKQVGGTLKTVKQFKRRAIRKLVEDELNCANNKITKKNNVIKRRVKNMEDILAKELTKKVPKKVKNLPPEKESEEPTIITMKQKSSSGSQENPPCQPLNDDNTKKSSGNAEISPIVPVSIGTSHGEYTTIEEDGKTWTVPKPLKPSEYNLVLPVDEHKDEKIADINVLRRMLREPKVRLSNGIQISLPSSSCTIYECDHCTKMFRAKQDLKKHMLIHLNQRPHACTVCNRTFRQRGNLRTHMSRLHSAVLPAPQTFICDHCGARFFVKESIRIHLLKHNETRAYCCQECNKSFSRAPLLDAHKRTRHAMSRFYCYMCSASYPTRGALDSHVKRHINVTRDLTCGTCGDVFSGVESMKKHMELRHWAAKNLTCPVCSKTLKGHLREHLRTHASAKPYACAECGKQFAQTSQLAVHKRSHTGLKPYVCRVCKRPFTHSNALILHIRIHTGEKPFACAMCPQVFAQLPHMKSHMLHIHNKRETYKCKDCGEFFKLRVALEKHHATCSRATPWLNELPPPPIHKDTPTMTLTKMRFLLAILLQTIADQHRLHLLALLV